jgi:hypothetical protein
MFLSRLRSLTIPLLVTTILVLPACGSDSPTGNSGDALSPVEAQFVVAALFDVLDLIEIPLLDGPPAAAGPAQTPYGQLYDPEIGGNQDCFTGLASISGLITGDVDQNAETADLSASATVDFDACVVPGEVVSFTLDGAPDVDLSADIDISPDVISITLNLDGAVAYAATDNRSGTCAIDLTIVGSASSAGVTESMTGSACGTPASQLDVSLF